MTSGRGKEEQQKLQRQREAYGTTYYWFLTLTGLPDGRYKQSSSLDTRRRGYEVQPLPANTFRVGGWDNIRCCVQQGSDRRAAQRNTRFVPRSYFRRDLS